MIISIDLKPIIIWAYICQNLVKVLKICVNNYESIHLIKIIAI